MPDHRLLTTCLLLVSFLAAGSLCHAEPAVTARDVPPSLLKRMNANFRPKVRPTSQEQFIKIMTEQTAEILKLGQSAEKEYPGAKGLTHVRGMMLEAAGFLQENSPGKANKSQLLAIASRIMGSGAPDRLKAQADFVVTRWKIAPAPNRIAKDAAKQILDYLKRHDTPKVKVTAIVRGTIMAGIANLDKLRDELATILEEKYDAAPGVTGFLLGIGRNPTFRAKLTKLDSTTLSLPDDLLGKVVVIDFWATWCRPCLQSLPHMKQVYTRYKKKGVEIVGISFDRKGKKDMLAGFVKKHNLDWIHTYSGKYWDDPTGRKYGISGIPAIWVIGKDGKILSNNARSNLERIIDKALRGPTANVPDKKHKATPLPTK
ncbi:MAG: TlpA disulfide reductase family protein [Phycisphaerae bacterium]|jgi:thiol-disulfide isomerase/thioredoxin|nr:TlpA disulfide reductase family protein [Phycisphaerae bacterium]